MILAMLVGSDLAEAAGFQAKTMRAPLSASEVERPLIIGRGWLEFELGADVKYATGYWDSAGVAQDFQGAEWLYTTERLGVRYGITRRSEFYWNIPFHYVRLTNPRLGMTVEDGTATSDFGLGDLSAGYRYEFLRRDAPTTSVIFDLKMKMPSGSEAPASYIGGPNTVSAIVLSTGQPDLWLMLRGKQQVGPVGLELGAGYIRRFSAVTQFVVEVEEYQFQGRFKPGDEIHAEAKAQVQLGPVAVGAEAIYGYRLVSAVGTTSSGLIPDASLDAIPGTDGDYLDVRPGAVVNITRGVDLNLGATIPVLGVDLAFWPLEVISPTRGITGHGSIELRY